MYRYHVIYKCAVMLNFETGAYAFYYLITEAYVAAQKNKASTGARHNNG